MATGYTPTSRGPRCKPWQTGPHWPPNNSGLAQANQAGCVRHLVNTRSGCAAYICSLSRCTRTAPGDAAEGCHVVVLYYGLRWNSCRNSVCCIQHAAMCRQQRKDVSRRRRAMPARTGQDYLKGLQEQEREIWLSGERIKDVTTHAGLRHGARAIASLYDMQVDPQLRDEMTYVSPTTGEPVGLSFIIPRTMDDLERRRIMMLHWARTTCGMMGRSPDFMNVNYAAWAAAADFFAQNRSEFGDNVRRYYEYIREKIGRASCRERVR